MSAEKLPIRPQESPENEQERHPTTEEEKMILEMQGEKGVKKVIKPEDRRREKEEADLALKTARRKILGETKEGQQEMFRE